MRRHALGHAPAHEVAQRPRVGEHRLAAGQLAARRPASTGRPTATFTGPVRPSSGLRERVEVVVEVRRRAAGVDAGPVDVSRQPEGWRSTGRSGSSAHVRPTRSAPGPRPGSSGRCGSSGSSPATIADASRGSVPGIDPTALPEPRASTGKTGDSARIRARLSSRHGRTWPATRRRAPTPSGVDNWPHRQRPLVARGVEQVVEGQVVEAAAGGVVRGRRRRRSRRPAPTARPPGTAGTARTRLTRTQPDRLKSPTAWQALRIATTSACAVGSRSRVTRLTPSATTSSPRTMRAANGPPPSATLSRRCPRRGAGSTRTAWSHRSP